MGINLEITRQLDNGNVQIDVTSKDSGKRYFQVPAQKAKSFMDNYKKQDKKISYITNTSFALSLLAGVLLTNIATRKLVKSKVLQYILNTAGGVTGATVSIFATGNYINDKKQELLKQHKAKEIFYNA